MKLLPLAAALVALALPASAFAQGGPSSPPGNSGNTPAADNSQGRPFQDGGMAPVPEPSTWLALGSLAAVSLVLARRRLKKGVSTS